MLNYLDFVLINDCFFLRIDATVETGRLGRLINHVWLDGNIIPRKFMLDGIPRIIFIAVKDIPKGTTLLYDYGETSHAVKQWPWMRMSMLIYALNLFGLLAAICYANDVVVYFFILFYISICWLNIYNFMVEGIIYACCFSIFQGGWCILSDVNTCNNIMVKGIFCC